MHPRPSSSRRAPEPSAPSTHVHRNVAPTSSLRTTAQGSTSGTATAAAVARPVRRTVVATKPASFHEHQPRGDSYAASVASLPSPVSAGSAAHRHHHHRERPAPATLSTLSSAAPVSSSAAHRKSAATVAAARHPSSVVNNGANLSMASSGYRVQRERQHDGVERDVIVLDSDSDDEAKPSLKRARPAVAGAGGHQLARYDERAYVQHARADAQALAYGAYAVAPNTSGAAGVKRKRKGAEVDDGPLANLGPPAPPEEPCDDKEGHFIVRSNLELNNRYRITKLLGQGTFGKVVQCVDQHKGRHVAVKIIRAVQKYRDASKVEIRVLKLLKDKDPLNVNKCIHLLDCFDYRNHICIVSELLSTSVFDFLKDNGYAPFPLSQIQSFARQLLGSVAFLHDLRLIHTDLKPENILLVNNEATKAKGLPPGQRRKVLKSSDIRLIDFGSATFEDDYHASVVSTRHYRAPEIILGLGWSYPCDAWSIGCILIEFFTGEALFQTHENLEHLAMMEAVFGKMPSLFAKHAVRTKPEFFRGYKLDFPQATTSRQSRKYVKQMKPLVELIPASTIVMSRFQDLLRKLLTWDPKDRITVREALKHPYFSLDIEDEVL